MEEDTVYIVEHVGTQFELSDWCVCSVDYTDCSRLMFCGLHTRGFNLGLF